MKFNLGVNFELKLTASTHHLITENSILTSVEEDQKFPLT